VRLAAQTWSASAPAVPRFTARQTAALEGPAFAVDNRDTVSWGDIAPFSVDTLAAAQLVLNQRKEVKEFDVLLNRAAPWAVLSSSAPAEAFDIQSIMTHVFGYVLGLGESEDCGSAMYSRVGPGNIRMRRLSSGDRAGLRRLYP
jgi:hypothetical protein